MSLKLESIVPWGRRLWEYRSMFDLSDADLNRSILGVADGPASFNAELTTLGGRVVSCDPIYAFSAPDIRRRFEETEPRIRRRVEEHPDHYAWKQIPTLDDLLKHRHSALDLFLSDFVRPEARGRYLAAELPRLPFEDKAFDLCLCSHLLFTYHEHLNVQFHMAAVAEMLRVAREVRLYPLIGLDGVRAPGVDSILRQFNAHEVPSPYEHQRGATHHLRVMNQY